MRVPLASAHRALAYAALAAIISGGCTAAATSQAGNAGTGTYSSRAIPDDTTVSATPAGYGTLRQDDLSFHVEAPGVLVRALPLDESLIRLLTPDSYRALRDLKDSKKHAIAAIARRNGVSRTSIWFVSFYGTAPDVRFTPFDVTVTSSGQEYRAYDIIPLTAGFGEQQLRQRETQNALYVFDGAIQLEQPVIVGYQGVKDDSWEQTLQRIERERAMVRARSGQTR